MRYPIYVVFGTNIEVSFCSNSQGIVKVLGMKYVCVNYIGIICMCTVYSIEDKVAENLE